MAGKKKEVFTNREISWLQFNERVLEEAESETTPSFERLKFLSIFMSNLDEFYRVRTGMLADEILLDNGYTDKQTGMTADEQLRQVWMRTRRLIPRFNAAYKDAMGAVRKTGIAHANTAHILAGKDGAFLKDVFKYKVAPGLVPFVVEKGHPLPFFENEQLIVGVTLKTKKGNLRFGFIPIPADLPRLIRIPSNPKNFILVEELVALYADRVFHKFTVEDKAIFSIIRSADIDENDGLYDYDTDFRDTMTKIVDIRENMAPVAVKYQGKNLTKILDYLAKALFLKKKQFFEYETPLEFDFLSEVEPLLAAQKTKQKVFYPVHTPVANAEIGTTKTPMDVILKKDVLASYPFESISAMVNLIQQAATDSRVTEISMTLYRAAHKSKIVSALTEAAEGGKKVTCVVELRARFDEPHNIELTERLQTAGVTVIYGLPKYKVHSKLLLIELADGRSISLIGTGNFNETTAKFYTDVALMTADAGIAKDIKSVFRALASETFVEDAEHLLVSPLLMKPKLIELIDEEIERKKSGMPAAIVMKMNALTEKDMMEKLIEASKAGVKIDLIIRGVCCLVPGIAGETENIRIRSIVGRYLEHSRIFMFGAGRGNQKKFYISSADIMTRNLTGRVEVAAPVYDKAAKKKLKQILDLCLTDTVNARVQRSNGKYVRLSADKRRKVVNSQEALEHAAELALVSADKKTTTRKRTK